ncbi:hypothetical protein [Alteraurantiacibacter buctensis]|uniref:Uncharacterized protein n=1 Tax=Alteraurantiacibacter buctensis TaxID=1503981 RepID=A0A844Z1R8_9SPHN|nr:hypothetical protein [Alteraurantiacibacter buctensis]MXO73452.1 hypothetical protein [Alteraurantiacibacter buctensis]
MTHGPIQADQRELMNAIARSLDDVFNPGETRRIAFVVLTAKFGDYEGGRVNYISNGERADIICMMKETIARFEGRYIDQGGKA